MYCPVPNCEADKRALSQPSIQKFVFRSYRTTHQKQGNETASTVRHAPKPTERPLAAPAMALIDAVAPSATAEAAQRWCRVWCKTKCNKLPECMQRSRSQPYSPLHGMQGVSGSSPLGSILKTQARPGFFNALVHDLVHGSRSLHSSVFQRAGFTRRRTRSTGRCSSSSSPFISCTGAKGVRGSSSPTHPHRCLPCPFCGK